jgi:tRNA(Ile)-lysidine synthase
MNSHLQPCVISLDKANSLTLRLRQGGETLRPTHTVKNLLQKHSVPPWLRERLPLVCYGERLVAVVGVAVTHENHTV